MLGFLIVLALGIFTGWFFVAPPAWAHTLLAKLVEKVPALAQFVRKD